jgi:hypothetical protein
MRTLSLWFGILLSCSLLPAQTPSAADLKILPGDITLTGPHASQRLLIAAEEGGTVFWTKKLPGNRSNPLATGRDFHFSLLFPN